MNICIDVSIISIFFCNFSYSALYGKLVNIGIGGPGSLEFAQAVLHLLDVSEVFVDSPDWLWRLWSTVVNPLHEFILKVLNHVNKQI